MKPFHTWLTCALPLCASSAPCLIVESFIIVGFVWLIGCAASQPIEPSPIQKALIGKSKQELVSCAGLTLEETKTAEGTVLKYYKEAPMFEESTVFSKSSRAGVHHGCWAYLLLTDDRVVGVEYRSVPSSVDATDHCEEIFQGCAHDPQDNDRPLLPSTP